MKRKSGLVLTFAVTSALLVPAGAGARTQVVWAGGPTKFQGTVQKLYGGEVNAFFPRSVTIHQGDSISWQGMSPNFHSIDLPGLSGKDLPLIIPNGSTANGYKDAAGNPFWFNGLPLLAFNPALLGAQGGHSYAGTSRVSSGLPLGPTSAFKVTFTKPGNYVYFCDVHYDMRGTIVVKRKSAKVPSAAQNAQAVDQQVARDELVAKALSRAKVRGHRVSLGVAGRNNVEILAMFPARLHVSKGAVVTFSMPRLTGETHTVTFGPIKYLNPLSASFGGGPFIDPRAVYPSSPGTIQLSPTAHGNGFANTGALDVSKATPLGSSSRIKFTKAGTYRFICLIHPFMHGTIIVK